MAIAEELTVVLKLDSERMMLGMRQAKTQLDNIKKSSALVSTEGKRLSTTATQTGASLEKAAKSAANASQRVKDLGGSFGAAKSSILGLRSALVGGLAALGIAKVTDTALAIGDLSKVTGESANNIRAFGNMFEQANGKVEDAQNVIRQIANDMDAVKAGQRMSQMGLALSNLQIDFTKTNPIEAFFQAGEKAMTKFGNNQKVAMKFLRDAGFSEKAAIIATTASIREQYEQQKLLTKGTDEQIAAANQLNKSINALKQQFENIGLKTLPMVIPLVSKFGEGLSKVLNLASQHPEEAELAIKGIGLAALAAKGPIGMAVAGLIVLYETLSKLFGFAQDIVENGTAQQKAVVLNEHEQLYSADEEGIVKVNPKAHKGKGGEVTGESTWLDSLGQMFKGVIPEAAASTLPSSYKTGTNASKVSKDPREALKEHLRKSEGLRKKAYLDAGGVATIGYGHTEQNTNGAIKMGDKITNEEAEAYLESDMQRLSDQAFKQYEKFGLKIQMLAADLAFNGGLGAVEKGTKFWNLAQKGDISQNEYNKLYITPRGSKKPLQGLINRRNNMYALASQYGGQSGIGMNNVVQPMLSTAAQAAGQTNITTDNSTTTNNVTNSPQITINLPDKSELPSTLDMVNNAYSSFYSANNA